jgi:hypothetical protein
MYIFVCKSEKCQNYSIFTQLFCDYCDESDHDIVQ